MIKNNNIFLLTILLTGGILLLISCATVPVGISPSTTPLNNKTISTNLGKVEGSHSVMGVLYMMFDRPDIDMAIYDALAKKGGDALINVRCYEKTIQLYLISYHKVYVVGEAVKFKSDEEGKDGKK